jgi:fructan beta-fructosidase
MKTKNIIIFLVVFSYFISSCKNIILSENPVEKYRPEFHFTPDSMWMNDPNGLVYYQGEYHLFYQHYPNGTVWGPMHWGHATSTDLVHWKYLPIALYPDSLGYIFSGSAVFDTLNTSGLGTAANPPLVAIFTYHNMEKEKAGRNDCQYQGIAFSVDKGQTWAKYTGNPVLSNPGIRDFRDPKVMWYEPARKWVMVLAVNNFVRFYSSSDLKEWVPESEFGAIEGAHGGIWECPDIFPMNTDAGEKWVLLVSMNNGAPNGGSGTQYFIGDFDGQTFKNANAPNKIYWLDYGKDNYAGVTWSNIPETDGRRLFIGWMSNWQYANLVPTVRWRNSLTVPRSLELKKFGIETFIITNPVNELASLRKSEVNIPARVISGSLTLQSDTSQSFTGEFDLVFQTSDGPQFGLASEFGIEISNSSGESLIIGFDPLKNEYFIDRTQAGKNDFSPDFTGKHYAKSYLDGDIVNMRVMVDESSVELFADGGRTVMTELFFSEEVMNHIKLFASNGSVKLKSGSLYSFK